MPIRPLTNPRTTRPRKPAAGFSLIEILIVISIIGLLAGIGFVAARSMMLRAEISQAQSLVAAAAGVPTEILASTDKPLEYRNHPTPTDSSKFEAKSFAADPVDPNVEDNWNSINFLIVFGNQNPKAKAMLQGINREFYLLDEADAADMAQHRIVDPWGQPLRYSAFSNNSTANDPSDDFYGATTSNNGTGNYNGDYGMPKRRTPYVASAGPDRLWGKFDTTTGALDTASEGAEDNIYSFEVE